MGEQFAQYLEFKKAFDKVPHRLWKLENIGGLKGAIKNWIEDYLKGREMRTAVTDEKSEWSEVKNGLPLLPSKDQKLSCFLSFCRAKIIMPLLSFTSQRQSCSSFFTDPHKLNSPSLHYYYFFLLVKVSSPDQSEEEDASSRESPPTGSKSSRQREASRPHDEVEHIDESRLGKKQSKCYYTNFGFPGQF